MNLLRLSSASGFALSILLLLGVSGRPAAAVELRTGDVLVADFLVPGIVHVTTSTGEQVVLPDPDDVLDGPTGVALAAHPGAPERRVVWVADSGAGPNLVALDPDDGSLLGSCTSPDVLADVEVASDGTLYAVGNSLLRYEVAAGAGDAITCTGPTELSDLVDEIGAGGQALALVEDETGVVEVLIALGINGGLASYDVAGDSAAGVPGTPTPAGQAVYGVHAAGDAIAFTQLAIVLPNCAAESGVFGGSAAFAPLSQGGLLRCPVGIAGEFGGRFVVSDQASLVAAPNPRLVRLAFQHGAWTQALVAEGPPMVAPFDVEVVPEPAGGGAAALAACALLARRRRRRSR